MELAVEFKQRGLEPVIATRRLPDTARKEKMRGAAIVRCCGKLYPMCFLVELFVRFLLKQSYDVIHVHTLNSPAFIAIALGFVLRKPVLLKVTRSGKNSQIDRYMGSSLGRTLFRFLTRHTSRFIAITGDIIEELRSAGVPEDKIAHIPNGVHPSKSGVSPKDESARIFVYVGRLIRRKRVSLLLEAWAKADLPEGCGLLVVGNGREKEQLERFSSELGIGDAVSFLGELEHEQVKEVLHKADVFVLPSDSEGMSNALLEGMAHGLAVVAARIEANASLIDDGVNGLLFGSAEELSQQISLLAQSCNECHRLARAARETIVERHEFGHVASQYIDLYSRVTHQTR
jgi:glycosyltransferase involved in cell wall biosynthesis